MDMITITSSGYKCHRCGHAWVPRKSVYPRICPKCKSPYWDRDKRLAKKVGDE